MTILGLRSPSTTIPGVTSADIGGTEVSGVPADSPLAQARQRVLSAWLTFHADVPRRLYHYTRMAGLRGIVETSLFWASHAEYLSDASELGYATALIQEVVADEASRVASERIRSLAERPEVVDPLLIGLRPFVVCFCENRDLLSQWRGYGTTGPAYALGLDLRSVSALRLQSCVLRKVIYSRDEQEALVRSSVHAWADAIEAQVSAGTPEEAIYPYPALWTLQSMLVEQYLCFKNPAFSEEQEWRLIKLVNVREELRYSDDLRREAEMDERQRRWKAQGIVVPPTPLFATSKSAEGLSIAFRDSAFGFVPYVNLDITGTAGVFTGRLPLWEVVHGPTAHPDLALASLKLYLEGNSYGFHTEVALSGIPLRGG